MRMVFTHKNPFSMSIGANPSCEIYVFASQYYILYLYIFIYYISKFLFGHHSTVSEGPASSWAWCWAWSGRAAGSCGSRFGCGQNLNSLQCVFLTYTRKKWTLKAPNPLNMVHQRPDRGELLRYGNARKHQALYTAAARLWSHGVPMAEAIKIVSEAMSI